MSTIYLITIVLGLAGTAIFAAGFVKGLREAIAEYSIAAEPPEPEGETSYAWSAVVAVIVSALVIAGVGFSPYWIYAGPLLAIASGTGVGIAFFAERRAQA